jgi:hypothetical protein
LRLAPPFTHMCRLCRTVLSDHLIPVYLRSLASAIERIEAEARAARARQAM